MKKVLSVFILVCFLVTGQMGTYPVYAQDFRLPAPGVMVNLSPEFNPPILKGIKVHPDNPFHFDFILDKGDSHLGQDQLKDESSKLIKYFLASLTIPEKDLWVNLSPYEKNRIVPESFGQTEMGRDLLAEDYMLKQITASLIYPEGEVGKKFWKRVYEEAAKKFGTTNIPVNTFNKVWIVPEKAVVYENAKSGTAYVVETKLKVMLEGDYLSLSRHSERSEESQNVNQLGSQIIREIVIPELTKEVNEGKNFSQLRQVYNSLILATWYKKKIKDSILEQVYADKKKVAGVSIDDPQETQRIYQRYLQAFKKGVYNYIKEEPDSITNERIARKYFSGGVAFEENINPAMTRIDYVNPAQLSGNFADVKADFNIAQKPDDDAMQAATRDLVLPGQEQSESPAMTGVGEKTGQQNDTSPMREKKKAGALLNRILAGDVNGQVLEEQVAEYNQRPITVIVSRNGEVLLGSSNHYVRFTGLPTQRKYSITFTLQNDRQAKIIFSKKGESITYQTYFHGENRPRFIFAYKEGRVKQLNEERVIAGMESLNGLASAEELSAKTGIPMGTIYGVFNRIDWNKVNEERKKQSKFPIYPEMIHAGAQRAWNRILRHLEERGGISTITEIAIDLELSQSTVSETIKGINFDYINQVRANRGLFPLEVFYIRKQGKRIRKQIKLLNNGLNGLRAYDEFYDVLIDFSRDFKLKHNENGYLAFRTITLPSIYKTYKIYKGNVKKKNLFFTQLIDTVLQNVPRIYQSSRISEKLAIPRPDLINYYFQVQVRRALNISSQAISGLDLGAFQKNLDRVKKEDFPLVESIYSADDAMLGSGDQAMSFEEYKKLIERPSDHLILDPGVSKYTSGKIQKMRNLELFWNIPPIQIGAHQYQVSFTKDKRLYTVGPLVFSVISKLEGIPEKIWSPIYGAAVTEELNQLKRDFDPLHIPSRNIFVIPPHSIATGIEDPLDPHTMLTIAAMLDEAEKFKDATVIDIGSGYGPLPDIALALGARKVYAFDNRKSLLEMAFRGLAARGWKPGDNYLTIGANMSDYDNLRDLLKMIGKDTPHVIVLDNTGATYGDLNERSLEFAVQFNDLRLIINAGHYAGTDEVVKAGFRDLWNGVFDQWLGRIPNEQDITNAARFNYLVKEKAKKILDNRGLNVNYYEYFPNGEGSDGQGVFIAKPKVSAAMMAVDRAMGTKAYEFSHEGRSIRLHVKQKALAQGLDEEQVQKIADAIFRKGEEPSIESGRSLIIRQKPFAVNGRQLNFLQIKGVNFKGTLPTFDTFAAGAKDKITQPENTFEIINGFVHVSQATRHPAGAMLLERAKIEEENMSRAFEMGVDTGYPVAWGEWTGVDFDGKGVGFVIIALEDNTERIGTRMSETKDFKSLDELKQYWQNISDYTREMAHALRQLHDKGITHGNPHPYQFSKLADGRVIVHDFDTARFSADISKEEFIYRNMTDVYGLLANIERMLGLRTDPQQTKMLLDTLKVTNPLESAIEGYFTADELRNLDQSRSRIDQAEDFLNARAQFSVECIRQDMPIVTFNRIANQFLFGRLLTRYAARIYDQLKNPTMLNRAEGTINPAQASQKNTGGIDLTSNKFLQTQNAGESIKFHLNPAQLAQLQNAPGFVPVIINIQPMTNLREFLGLNVQEDVPRVS